MEDRSGVEVQLKSSMPMEEGRRTEAFPPLSADQPFAGNTAAYKPVVEHIACLG